MKTEQYSPNLSVPQNFFLVDFTPINRKFMARHRRQKSPTFNQSMKLQINE